MTFFPLETERLILRAIRPEDAVSIAAYQGLAEVARYVPWEPRSLARVEELIPRWIAMDGTGEDSEGVQYAITRKSDGALVGDCMIMFGDRAARQGEVGYLMNPVHQGLGYATEATRAMIGAAFEIGGLHRISARCDARNTASWRVMERLGMRREAHFREHAIFKGEWDEELIYAILEDEWRGGELMAGTDTSREFVFRPTPAIILVEPQLGENIGAAARAMANFGLSDLRLVAPRDGWPNEKATASAAKALPVIERVQVFDTLAEAMADLHLVYATTARNREMYKPVIGPDEAADRLAAHIGGGQKAGILFGRERWGLNNEEVALADAIVTLPVEPAFASLNIAQAVLVLAYEWRRAALKGEPLPFAGEEGEPAPREQLVGLVEQLGEALDRVTFFKSPDKRPGMMNNIRSMFARAGFNAQEVRTLRGIVAALDRRHERVNPTRRKAEEPEQE